MRKTGKREGVQAGNPSLKSEEAVWLGTIPPLSEGLATSWASSRGCNQVDDDLCCSIQSILGAKLPALENQDFLLFWRFRPEISWVYTPTCIIFTHPANQPFTQRPVACSKPSFFARIPALL